MMYNMVDIHSHFWEYPKHFSDDFKRQAARPRRGQTLFVIAESVDWSELIP